MSQRIRIASVDDLAEDESKLVLIRGKEVALFRRNGRFYALANQCPHQGGPLGEGFFDGDYIICPWHHWDFHLETGQSRLGTDICVRTYPIEVDAGEVYILVPGTAPSSEKRG